MFQITHLQRAYVLKHYVEGLLPKVKGVHALKGNTTKNYLDAIQRKMHELEEREDNSLWIFQIHVVISFCNYEDWVGVKMLLFDGF